MAELRYDRRVSESLIELLSTDPGRSLVRRRNEKPDLLDVQLRSWPNSSTNWASLYVGLTTVLDLKESRDGRFRLKAHKTHRKNGRFPESLDSPLTREALIDRWDELDAYLDRVIPSVTSRHTAKEGAVHAAMCSDRSDAYQVVDREAAVKFKDTPSKKTFLEPIAEKIHDAVDENSIDEPWWPGGRPSLGTGLDILAIGSDGRLLAIEAKPSTSLPGITWGPAQVRFYAEIFAAWAEQTADPAEILNGMREQRFKIGVTSDRRAEIREPIEVVPVIAIGAGKKSNKAIPRLEQVAAAVATAPKPPHVAPFEVWLLDENGHPSKIQQF